jgi:integrase
MVHGTEEQQASTANKRTHLTEAEMMDILELARQTDPRDWAMLVCAFHHGLRVTEVIDLRLTDSINWKDRTITVKRLLGGSVHRTERYYATLDAHQDVPIVLRKGFGGTCCPRVGSNC